MLYTVGFEPTTNHNLSDFPDRQELILMQTVRNTFPPEAEAPVRHAVSSGFPKIHGPVNLPQFHPLITPMVFSRFTGTTKSVWLSMTSSIFL